MKFRSRKLLVMAAVGLGILGAGLTAHFSFAGVESGMELGVNRYGGDYTSFVVPSADPGACSQACASDGRCVAWSFVKPGSQASQAVCWLKSQAPQPALNPCCISGTVARTAGGGGIQVTSATYGGNCKVPQGNVTGVMQQACNGRASCDYKIDYHVIGDPAGGCAKDFAVYWNCSGGGQGSTGAAPEAGFGSVVSLRCPAQ